MIMMRLLFHSSRNLVLTYSYFCLSSTLNPVILIKIMHSPLNDNPPNLCPALYCTIYVRSRLSVIQDCTITQLPSSSQYKSSILLLNEHAFSLDPHLVRAFKIFTKKKNLMLWKRPQSVRTTFEPDRTP
ncbi:hypothetical protein SISSUDRAFT_274622 [Sistotremastrum suecicum HHB10207 ss-3]|uniref:Uncharacterized protein n=1 Tax=Sistotremastrum suecicum HHB10207 ss-3 TaxID=1314776 RepID=A0A165ZP02_9AGAM|nr:hypothetical protein SISSUDRAFT_274622 [Sistotremastrum suecicum HHB10207 ss-3]